VEVLPVAAPAGSREGFVFAEFYRKTGDAIFADSAKVHPLSMASKAGSKFLFSVSLYRKTALHFSGRTLGARYLAKTVSAILVPQAHGLKQPHANGEIVYPLLAYTIPAHIRGFRGNRPAPEAARRFCYASKQHRSAPCIDHDKHFQPSIPIAGCDFLSDIPPSYFRCRHGAGLNEP
jgi:hypothetical protein